MASIAVASMGRKANAGVVVSAGRMMKTVTVRMQKEQWNRKLRKNYTVPYNLLVNDPTSAVVTGDIVTLAPERHSRHVGYTIDAIVAPFGKPLDERPALLNSEQRLAIYQEKRARKADRRKERAALMKEGVVEEGETVDIGEVEIRGRKDGKGKVVEAGREVLEGGLHRFGKINEELIKGKRKVLRSEGEVTRNLKELKKVPAS